MRSFLAPLCMAVLIITAMPGSAQEPGKLPPSPAGPISFVTRLEVDPTWVKEAMAALEAYRKGSLQEAGALRVRVYQEISRKNRFLIDEAWKDFAAYQAHARSSELALALKAGLLAPPDGRPYTDWLDARARTAPGANALYVFTHIDVHPPQLADLQALLRPHVERGRGTAGVLRFDVLQGLLTLNEEQMGKIANRKNHMTLAEAWTGEADFLSHERSAETIAFRNQLGPLLGALYDQRLYTLMK
jgi:quinol monooxygenase YgiN